MVEKVKKPLYNDYSGFLFYLFSNGSGSSQYYEDAEGYRHSTEGMDVQEPFNWLDL